MAEYRIKPIEKPRKDKRHHGYRNILFIGLAVMATSIIARFVMYTIGFDIQGQDVLEDQLQTIKDVSNIWLFLYACLLVPFLEEFSYRSWTTGRHRSRWISWGAMTLYTLLTKQWVIAGLFSVTVLLINLRVRRRRKLMWSLSLATSMCFALAHLSGFGSFNLNTIFMLLQLFGLAMTLSYVGLRFHWLKGVILHGCVNILGISAMFISPQANTLTDKIVDTTDEYRFVLSSNNNLDESYGLDNTFTFCSYRHDGSIESIYRHLLFYRYEDQLAEPPAVDTLFETTGAWAERYTFIVALKEAHTMDYDSVLVHFEDLAADMGYTLSTDTLYTDPVVITAYAIK